MNNSSLQGMNRAAPTETWEGQKRLLNRLRMRQLALLLALKQGRTLSAAASEVGVTQPAATKLLRELEAALGRKLFDRSGRQLRVTPAGELAMTQFEVIRGTIEALGRRLQSEDEDSGTLVIGSIMTATSHLLAPSISALREALPGWTVRLSIDSSERLLEGLERGVMDIVIGRPHARFSNRDFEYRELATEQLALVVSPGHRLAGRRRVTLKDLSAESWVLPPRDLAVRQLIDREFQLARQDVPLACIETPSLYATLCLVADGHHVAAMSMPEARLLERHGMLSVLPLKVHAGLEAYGTIVDRRRPLSVAGIQFLKLMHTGRSS